MSRREKDSRAIQSDELPLVLHQGIAPSPGHLGNAVDASCQDGQESDDDGRAEEAELERLQLRFWRFGGILVKMPAHEVDTRERTEDDQRDDLKDDAANCEVVAQSQLASLARRARGQSSAGGL